MLSPRAALLGLLLSRAIAVVAQTTATPPAWQTGAITEDGTCGSTSPNNWVCTPTWGACCGADGLCGRGEASCGTGWYVLATRPPLKPTRSTLLITYPVNPSTATATPRRGRAPPRPTAPAAARPCTTARAQPSGRAAVPTAGAAPRRASAAPAARRCSARVLSAMSLLMVCVAPMGRSARALGLGIAARRMGIVGVRLTTVVVGARRGLERVLWLRMFRVMAGVVSSMGRSARGRATAGAARPAATVVARRTTAVPGVRLRLARAAVGVEASRRMASVALPTARRALARRSARAARRAGTVGAPAPTAMPGVRLRLALAAVGVVASRPTDSAGR